MPLVDIETYFMIIYDFSGIKSHFYTWFELLRILQQRKFGYQPHIGFSYRRLLLAAFWYGEAKVSNFHDSLFTLCKS